MDIFRNLYYNTLYKTITLYTEVIMQNKANCFDLQVTVTLNQLSDLKLQLLKDIIQNQDIVLDRSRQF
jgi:hypothetical protein